MIGQVFNAGLAAVIPLVILALIVFAIVALVTARRDPDPTGSRPYTVYLVLIIFFSLFTALFALTAMASNIAKAAQGSGSSGACPPYQGACPLGQVGWTVNPLASSGSGSGSTSGGVIRVGPGVQVPPIKYRTVTYDQSKQATAAAVEAALVALVALAVLWWHVGRLRELVGEEAFNAAPGRRTYQVYLHAVSFTAAAIFIFAAAAGLYSIFRIAWPGYSAQGVPSNIERDAGVVQLVSAGFLAVASWLIFRYHWRRTQTLRGDNPLPPAHQVPPPRPPRHGPPAGPPRPTPPSVPPPATPAEPTPPPAPTPPEQAPPPVVPPPEPTPPPAESPSTDEPESETEGPPIDEKPSE